MTYPDHWIDKRVVERNIEKNLVDRKEYEKSLAQLPDVASNAEVIQVQQEDDSSEVESTVSAEE